MVDRWLIDRRTDRKMDRETPDADGRPAAVASCLSPMSALDGAAARAFASLGASVSGTGRRPHGAPCSPPPPPPRPRGASTGRRRAKAPSGAPRVAFAEDAAQTRRHRSPPDARKAGDAGVKHRTDVHGGGASGFEESRLPPRELPLRCAHTLSGALGCHLRGPLD